MNEIIEAVRTLLRDNLGASFKKYYYGEIRVPSQSMMPFIEVVPMGSNLRNRGTGGMMENEFQVTVTVKNTLKKYLNQSGQSETLEHVKDLVEMMEGRDDDGNLSASSVVGVLHSNLKLDANADIVDDWQITYDEIDLGESYITLASVAFTVKRITF